MMETTWRALTGRPLHEVRANGRHETPRKVLWLAGKEDTETGVKLDPGNGNERKKKQLKIVNGFGGALQSSRFSTRHPTTKNKIKLEEQKSLIVRGKKNSHPTQIMPLKDAGGVSKRH
jgi:hypothetical protein